MKNEQSSIKHLALDRALWVDHLARVHRALESFRCVAVSTGNAMEMDVHRCDGPPRPVASLSVSYLNCADPVMGVPLPPTPLTWAPRALLPASLALVCSSLTASNNVSGIRRYFI